MNLLLCNALSIQNIPLTSVMVQVVTCKLFLIPEVWTESKSKIWDILEFNFRNITVTFQNESSQRREKKQQHSIIKVMALAETHTYLKTMEASDLNSITKTMATGFLEISWEVKVKVHSCISKTEIVQISQTTSTGSRLQAGGQIALKLGFKKM